MAAKSSSALREEDRTLVITRVLDAPRALVFRLWTDPTHALKFWGPAEYPGVQLEMDVRPGGNWRGCLRNKEGRELRHHGVFREIVEPERLSFTFQWEEEGERGLETLVTITFAEQAGKTLMTFSQAPFVSIAERDSHNGGWSSMFDRLDALLAQRR